MFKSKVIALAAVLVMCCTAASAAAAGAAHSAFISQPGACDRYMGNANAQTSNDYGHNMTLAVLDMLEANPSMGMQEAFDVLKKDCSTQLTKKSKVARSQRPDPAL